MFDWDDQELANIIWGEGSEADDEIVRYTEDTGKKDLPDDGDNDKKKLTEGNPNRKAADGNTSSSKSLSDGGKQESNDAALRAVMDEHNLPSFSASKTDSDSIAKKSQLDIGLEISQNQHEDKELGELVGNSWANIGGFDDLDHIFSNDDLDGQTSLGSRDVLWSSSKDLISGACKSSSQTLGSTSWEFDALGNTAAPFEINSEYLLDENRSVVSRKREAISSYSQRNFGECVQQEEYAVRTTGLANKKTALGVTARSALDSRIAAEEDGTSNKSADEETWSINQSKHFQKTDNLTGSRLVGDIYDSCSSPVANVPQFDGQRGPATVQNYPASVHQQQLPRGSRSMPYQHFSSPCISTYAYGDFTGQYPATCMLKPTDVEHQSVLSNSEACPGNVISLNQPVETSTKPVNMTPQEKIEKLRRRQQMRAIRAIQLQQQQLGQQVSNIDQSLPQKICQEDQVLSIEKADFEADEGLNALPSYDTGSPNKRDDSSAVSDVDDYSVEDRILYQLQDIIARLDLKIRLCIRDSLYRLAQNAMQRSYSSDTSSNNRGNMYEHGTAKEETSSHERFARKAYVETETNHIDRVVAHLLFHRPFKFSSKRVDTPESYTSTKVSIEQKAAGANSMAVGFLTKSSENEYNLSPHDSKTSCPFVDSGEEDILSDITPREMRTNPQMNQNMTEHKD